jgi:hypothetical protein
MNIPNAEAMAVNEEVQQMMRDKSSGKEHTDANESIGEPFPQYIQKNQSLKKRLAPI